MSSDNFKEVQIATLASVIADNIFRQLCLYCEKGKVSGQPQSFDPARFSLTMTLNLSTSHIVLVQVDRCSWENPSFTSPDSFLWTWLVIGRLFQCGFLRVSRRFYVQ